MAFHAERKTAAFTAFVFLFVSFGAVGIWGQAAMLYYAGSLGTVSRELLPIVADPGRQWNLCACLFFVATTMAVFRLCHYQDTSMFWLCIFVTISFLNYSFIYSDASRSCDFLTLIVCVVMAQAIGLAKRKISEVPNLDHSKFDFWRAIFTEPSARRVGWLVLIILLTSASLRRGNLDVFKYHGDIRWNGPVSNPNTYGLLMGAGIVLAFGMIADMLTSRFLINGFKPKYWILPTLTFFGCVVLFLALAFMSQALLHSYSRGAWLATLSALAYLSLNARNELCNHLPYALVRFMQRNFRSLFITLFFSIVLVFWSTCKYDSNFVRRTVSIFNVSDFSWTNRVDAWLGALQIAVEHPWFGVGWSRATPLYEQYYISSKATDGSAIEMNDYLLLEATLGIPLFCCFLAYFWTTLSVYKPDVLQRPSVAFGTIVFRSATVLLLIGFWFDGGLFTLSTAGTFWILFELGREDLKPAA